MIKTIYNCTKSILHIDVSKEIARNRKILDLHSFSRERLININQGRFRQYIDCVVYIFYVANKGVGNFINISGRFNYYWRYFDLENRRMAGRFIFI